MIREDGHPDVYLILDGTRRWVPNPATLNGLFNGWIIKVVSGLQDLPKGPTMTNGALLVKSPSSPDVYLVNDGEKRWIINPTAFNEFDFDWKKIHTYPDVMVDAIPTGAHITAHITDHV